MLKITYIGNKKLNKALRLKIGDEILRCNGFDCGDILDYYYFDAEADFSLDVKSGNEIRRLAVHKDMDESMELEFESDNLDIKSCRNNCIFCFVDQMPKGLRDSLYVKDDDYRTSFMFGSFVTLTNCSDKDIDRIIRLNLSPLYISVQATDAFVREKMLNNRFAGKINGYLEKLNAAGIKMHTQVVLVKGVNDGEILKKTCFDLAAYDNVLSLAVVPCGITKYRTGLFNIDDIDEKYALSIIDAIAKINARLGKNFVLPADEFYLVAKKETPKEKFYNDYCQIENGVGMVRYFESTFPKNLQKSTYRRTFLIVTGVSAYPLISKYASEIKNAVEGIEIFVLPCENKFFGKSVTATGLLVGVDILEAAKNFDKEYDELCLSSNMFKDGEYVFLDGMTLKELSQKLNKPVRVTQCDGEDFFNKLTGECEYYYE